MHTETAMDPSKSNSPGAWHLFRRIALYALTSWLVTACALSPPVQEMSNARQSIQAAHDVQATEYAPAYLRDAEDLMKAASDALDSGDYYNARELAIAAQQQAIKARQQSLSRQKEVKN
jgi:predicted S18 family serine protease